MRNLLLSALALAAAAAMASEPGYRLRIDSSLQGGQLTVAPQIAAPAGSRLRYEVVSSRQGGAGKSSTSQGGSVTVGPDGSATLSKLSVSVGPQDKYVITVKVFDGAKLVAEEVLRHPQ
jgi:hypothetical protein